MMKALLCVILAFLFAVLGEGMATPNTATGSCEQINIPLCKDLPYTHTLMPNLLGHRTQEDAGLEVHQFYPLVKIQCSQAMKPFICSVYAPECESGRARAPCKRTCMAAKQGCHPLMTKFGSEWPEQLNCDKFSEETCKESETIQNITISDIPHLLQDIADHDKALSPTTWRKLFFYSDKDGSGNLNNKEYQEMKSFLTILRQHFTESWLPGRHHHRSFRRILEDRGVNLSYKTTEDLWIIYKIGKDDYDEFVVILTKLEILKGRFDAKVLSGLPCDCKIAGFTFDEFILNAAL
ncbi:frizzled-2-like [Alosa sapidissima]|uniref:frizzled-2-like n=1 Tax=Alosa sapidissima TaxID=34773 RepID=UPI001C080A8C|nr:frizzled-2-like [Alosa sapidissima]